MLIVNDFCEYLFPFFSQLGIHTTYHLTQNIFFRKWSKTHQMQTAWVGSKWLISFYLNTILLPYWEVMSFWSVIASRKNTNIYASSSDIENYTHAFHSCVKFEVKRFVVVIRHTYPRISLHSGCRLCMKAIIVFLCNFPAIIFLQAY